MKICPVEADLFHANGRKDMTKLLDFFFLILRTRLKAMFTTVPIMTRVFVTGYHVDPSADSNSPIDASPYAEIQVTVPFLGTERHL